MTIALPLGAAAGGLLLLVLLAGALAIALLAADIFNRIPVVGAPIARAIQGATVAAIRNVAGWAQALAQPLADVIAAPIVNVWSIIGAHRQTDTALAGGIWSIVNITIPRTAGAILGLVQADYDYLRNFTVSWAQYTLGLLQADYDYLRNLTVTSVQFTLALLQQDYDALSSRIQTTYNYLFGRIETRAAEATAYTDARAGQVADYARTVGIDVLRQAEWEITREAQRADAGLRDVLDYERQVANVLRRDIARAETRAADFATALAVPIAVAVRAIENSGCQRFCGPLGDLGQALQEIEDLGLVAALIALAAELARDPQGTARTIHQVAGPVLEGAARAAEAEAGFQRAA